MSNGVLAMNKPDNIILTGFMGTGKTTIGHLLAEKLNRDFVDMDEVIVQRTGLTIPRIFANHSESFFRVMERGLVHELVTQSGLVIATGGGTLIPDDLRELMANSGTLICLTASLETIEERIRQTDARPLAGEWRKRLLERQSAYASIKYQVDTTNRTPSAIAHEIIALTSHPISVQSPDGDYNIWIEPGLLANIGQHIDELTLDGHVIVATNDTIAPLYGEQLVSKLPNAHLITMPDGEVYKSLETVSKLYADCIDAGADRHTTLIALGGGVVGDTAGFVASTYMRGIRLVQIPTSLLAMVDSSVGGKVGVDLQQGKNLVGAFKQPDIVLIDPDVLQTLPDEQWRCGMAEVVKHGFIADKGLLDTNLHHPNYANQLVRRAVQVKVEIVQQDPYEQGVRAHLNLGHTFGHAIEKVTHYEWIHGEAVGFGCLAAAKLSHRLGLCDASVVQTVDSVLEEVGLPRTLKGLDPKAIYQAMTTDKKWKNGISRFVLLEAIEKPIIIEDVEPQIVIDVLKTLQ